MAVVLNTIVRLHQISERILVVEYFEDGYRRDTRRMVRRVAYGSQAERLRKLHEVDREWHRDGRRSC